MQHGDYHDRMYDEYLAGFHDDQEEEDWPRKEVACRNCGSTDVFWALSSLDGHRELFNTNGRRHVCKRSALKHRLDAFDPLG